jgi:RNA polymerase sigma-70 factor (ECF subfamily)
LMDEDIELVERFQNGDISAFDPLVIKYQNKVYDIVYSHIRNVEDAYDLSQDVFLKAFNALGRFRKKSSFYTWLYSIAINVCIDHSRKTKHYVTVPIEDWMQVSDTGDSMNVESSYSPAGAVELKELKHQLALAIDQLPPKQRTVFIMKRQQGLSLEEIANVLGRSVGTIKAHLFHATTKLTYLLKNYLE